LLDAAMKKFIFEVVANLGRNPSRRKKLTFHIENQILGLLTAQKSQYFKMKKCGNDSLPFDQNLGNFEYKIDLVVACQFWWHF
jgi:hypothetical protein